MRIINAILISVILLMSGYTYSQDIEGVGTDDLIILSFIKDKVEQPANAIYFNVFKIANYSYKAIEGDVTFIAPNDFQLIAYPFKNIRIEPGDSIFLPVRMSLSSQAKGGVTYILNGAFETKEKIHSKSTYITIPKESRWQMSLDKSKVYLNEFKGVERVKLRISNKGNSDEVIKLDFKVGKLLKMFGTQYAEEFEYIDLPAHKDTVITYTIKDNTELRQDERYLLENNFRESTIYINASTEFQKESGYIQFVKLGSSFTNTSYQKATPLNIDVQMTNLLSGTNPKYNTTFFGEILLPNKRDIGYHFGARNFMFKDFSEQDLSFARNTYFYVNYRDENIKAKLGDNIGSPLLHSMPGRGVIGTYRLDENNLFNIFASQGKYQPNMGASIGYSRRFKRTNLHSEVIVEDNKANNYMAYSLLLGSGYSFLKMHSITLDLLTTMTSFSNLDKYNSLGASDTSKVGFSYRLSYNFDNKKDIQFRITNQNSLNNFIRSSNNSRWNATGRYLINDKFNLNVIYDRNKILQTRYPVLFYQKESFTANDVGRAVLSFSPGNKVYFQSGPTFNLIKRVNYNPISETTNIFNSQNISLYNSVKFRLKDRQSISPYFSIGYLRATYDLGDESTPTAKSPYQQSIRAGVSYYSRNWRLSAGYVNGHTNISPHHLLYTADYISQSIHIRPHYERYFRNQTVKFSTYLNYIYSMPSGRENLNFTSRIHLYLPEGWSVNISNNVYANSRVDEEIGRVTNRFFNMFLGVRKSFDISQPRLKYYDLTLTFFHDMNGNREKDGNEPAVASILTTIKRLNDKEGQKQARFVETILVSSPMGEMSYENIPEGTYVMKFNPLENLKGLHFLNGEKQEIVINSDKNYMIPLVESYKIKGQIILIRDEFSSEKLIRLDGIRITATSATGATFSVLTDDFGHYILNIPEEGVYNIEVNNILGDHFTVDREKFEIAFNGLKNINLDFTFRERKREIKVKGEGGEIYQFKSLGRD